ncbi:hypothetical protein [Halopiger goleimassiliensis]|uniref:hypothetical protein n=1 Tax=Halopiger goleimassiliensis TaxID=1293048 RepID=UPI0012B560D4|nr:hypothetical protein [Halopiger goleimassiliensis]
MSPSPIVALVLVGVWAVVMIAVTNAAGAAQRRDADAVTDPGRTDADDRRSGDRTPTAERYPAVSDD